MALQKQPKKRIRNKEERKRASKRYYEKTKHLNKDKKAIQMKNWLLKNPDYHSEYRKNNKGILAAKLAKYRASKLKATPKWLTKLHYSQIQMFYKAARSLTDEIGIKFEVDHITPLQGKVSSGLHVPWNLQVLPLKDNRKKSNKIWL